MSTDKPQPSSEKPEDLGKKAKETPSQAESQAKFGDRDPGWTEKDVPPQQRPASAKSTDSQPTSETASEQAQSQA
ncbi:MAG: hypothetical protein AAFN08_09225, partial [Cyanobacteria bacterium J06559_3]